MYFDLKSFRARKNLTQQNMSDIFGVVNYTYRKYEKSDDIPAKYLHILHTHYPNDVKLPVDFYDYTTSNIKVNMSIYGMSQNKVAKIIRLSSTRLWRIFQKESILYDYKDVFDSIFPVIYRPCYRDENNIYIATDEIENIIKNK